MSKSRSFVGSKFVRGRVDIVLEDDKQAWSIAELDEEWRPGWQSNLNARTRLLVRSFITEPSLHTDPKREKEHKAHRIVHPKVPG
ncbi:hypothetical protein NMY22_g13681 [Coprinellus aureogranulatus]|nr:hypothetical protein NMY22_g13681 [Coprinellus aureogranulatus]